MVMDGERSAAYARDEVLRRDPFSIVHLVDHGACPHMVPRLLFCSEARNRVADGE
jgi:hypothetical protein